MCLGPEIEQRKTVKMLVRSLVGEIEASGQCSTVMVACE